jgi:hypothetical protein
MSAEYLIGYLQKKKVEVSSLCVENRKGAINLCGTFRCKSEVCPQSLHLNAMCYAFSVRANFFRSWLSSSKLIYSLPFMEPERSIPCLQEPYIDSCSEPEEFGTHPMCVRFVPVPSSHLRLYLPSDRFLQEFRLKCYINLSCLPCVLHAVCHPRFDHSDDTCYWRVPSSGIWHRIHIAEDDRQTLRRYHCENPRPKTGIARRRIMDVRQYIYLYEVTDTWTHVTAMFIF